MAMVAGCAPVSGYFDYCPRRPSPPVPHKGFSSDYLLFVFELLAASNSNYSLSIVDASAMTAGNSTASVFDLFDQGLLDLFPYYWYYSAERAALVDFLMTPYYFTMPTVVAVNTRSAIPRVHLFDTFQPMVWVAGSCAYVLTAVLISFAAPLPFIQSAYYLSFEQRNFKRWQIQHVAFLATFWTLMARLYVELAAIFAQGKYIFFTYKAVKKWGDSRRASDATLFSSLKRKDAEWKWKMLDVPNAIKILPTEGDTYAKLARTAGSFALTDMMTAQQVDATSPWARIHSVPVQEMPPIYFPSVVFPKSEKLSSRMKKVVDAFKKTAWIAFEYGFMERLLRKYGFSHVAQEEPIVEILNLWFPISLKQTIIPFRVLGIGSACGAGVLFAEKTCKYFLPDTV